MSPFWLCLLILPKVGFGELPFNRVDHFPTYPDICFRVDGYNFLCHKVLTAKVTHSSVAPHNKPRDPVTQVNVCLCLQAFFSGRSDYFKALLKDHFSEGEQLQSQPSTPVITLHNISHEIFIHVMYYIYSDDTQVSAPFLSEFFFFFCGIVCQGCKLFSQWEN